MWRPRVDAPGRHFMAVNSTLYLCLGITALIALYIIGQSLWPSMFTKSPRQARPTHPTRENRRAKSSANRFDLDELARRLDLTPRELELLHPTYRHVAIPKQRGGQRQLAIPNPKLKATQRLILRRLLAKLRTHHTATGFQPGTSIANNAAAHVGMAVVIKMDLIDFFPATSAQRIEAYFQRIGWTPEAAALLSRLTTHDGGLPQGAPTSPRLSNLVNVVMDAQIERWVAYRRGVYTRYADDITISFPKDYPKRIRGTIQHVRRAAKAHGYTIHTRGKLRVVRRHQQQRVTSLVVNDKVNLTREKRRWLRAVEHRLRTTGQASLTPQQLAGWQSLQHMVKTQQDRQS